MSVNNIPALGAPTRIPAWASVSPNSARNAGRRNGRPYMKTHPAPWAAIPRLTIIQRMHGTLERVSHYGTFYSK